MKYVTLNMCFCLIFLPTWIRVFANTSFCKQIELIRRGRARARDRACWLLFLVLNTSFPNGGNSGDNVAFDFIETHAPMTPPSPHLILVYMDRSVYIYFCTFLTLPSKVKAHLAAFYTFTCATCWPAQASLSLSLSLAHTHTLLLLLALSLAIYIL